ncbi:hypothetical protein ENSA7_72530 [Enhygromyxa salina]|uniref:Uncharacterized protein n=1 Tax=Enhygromyxa salina TaxID=215803 RepID=A0A2S9XU86_9BACT|nr:hypothetical protein ENSA7_72530 [Enhygromyxa salina]
MKAGTDEENIKKLGALKILRITEPCAGTRAN